MRLLALGAAVIGIAGLGFTSQQNLGAAHTSAPAALIAAPGCPPGSKPAGAGCIDKHPVLICKPAQRAVKFYAGRIAYWRSKMGAGSHATGVSSTRRDRAACPRYLAHVLQRKAAASRNAYQRWFEYHYHWQAWLPRLWYAIGMCETTLNWQHNSGTYQGAFGFWYGTWDSYKPRGAPSEAYLATPRQQYQAALNVAARVGLEAWGCYSHGGYKYHL